MIDFSLLILLVGVIILLIIFVRSSLNRIAIPPIVGYIFIGFIFRLIDVHLEFLTQNAREIFEFLAKVGIITLLFRIGLESNLSALLQQLRRASVIWISGVLLSGVLGYVTAYFILNLGLISSLFIAIALTATSVGISVGVWHEANTLKSKRGELLIDVAELDDISGVVLMSLLFTVAPILKHEGNSSLLPLLTRGIGLITLKLMVFGALCAIFSKYLERHITQFFQRISTSTELTLVVVGVSFIIAALAGLLGFSVAIGAFFAGIVFSRDPQAIKIDASFGTLYDFFSPFFFIGIGLSIDPNSFTSALFLGSVLLIAAVLGKVIGHGIPVFIMEGWIGFILLGISMVPRAEIAMIIMQRGLILGEWAVSSKVFSAMVFVSAATCIFSPLIVRSLLKKWKQSD